MAAYMGVHRTRFADQTVEVVAVHPHSEHGHVRLEVFTDDDVERLREVDVILDPDQAREIAASLVRHAELAERTWARALADGACPSVRGGAHDWTTAAGAPTVHCEHCGAVADDTEEEA